MKIALNASILTGKPDGIGVYTLELLKHLENYKDVLNFDVFLSIENIKINNTKPTTAGKFFDFLLKRSKGVHRLFWNLFCLGRISKKYDLIFSFSHHGSPFCSNQIITIHDCKPLNFPTHDKIQYLYFKYILPSVIKSSYKIVVISDFIKSEVLRFYPSTPEKKIVVIKNGLNLMTDSESPYSETKLLEITDGKPFFVAVGAAYPHKNIERLVEAIEQSGSTAIFIIVGKDNKYLSSIKALIKEKGLQNVKTITDVPSELLAMFYKRAICNLFVTLHEGFGFPPLEAANFNTVSIVSDIPCLKEIYDDTVVYIDPFNVKDIAAKINQVENKHINLLELKSKFPVLLKKYSWQKNAKQTITLIESYKKR